MQIVLDSSLGEHLADNTRLVPAPKHEGLDVAAVRGAPKPWTGRMLGSVTSGLSLDHRAIIDIAWNSNLGAVADSFVDRKVDQVSRSGNLSKMECSKDGKNRVRAGNMAGLPHRRCNRRRIVLTIWTRVVAARRHDATHGQLS